jgi:FkbM family methyltransferase
MIRRLLSLLRRANRAYLFKDEIHRSRARWRRDNRSRMLHLQHPLDAGSTVLDIGGYTGEWAAELRRAYGCHIHVFEPVSRYAEQIRSRFAGQPEVTVHPFGLGDGERRCPIAICGLGSGTLREIDGEREDVLIRDGAAAIRELGIGRIDLVKINIEGEEYALLPNLIRAGVIARCARLMIQFHLDVVADARGRRAAIQGELARTHDLVWDYPFIWELWQRRAAPPAPAS